MKLKKIQKQLSKICNGYINLIFFSWLFDVNKSYDSNESIKCKNDLIDAIKKYKQCIKKFVKIIFNNNNIKNCTKENLWLLSQVILMICSMEYKIKAIK